MPTTPRSGPFAGLVTALGIGVALTVGAGVAGADPDLSAEAGRSSAARPAARSPHAHSAQRTRHTAAATRPLRRAPAATRAHTRASATGGGVAALLANSSPTMNPTTGAQVGDGTVTGTLGAADADGNSLTYTVAVQPSHGSVRLDSDGTYTYTADAALASTGGTDSFVVTVSDATDGFHLHGLAGLINLLTFGLIGVSGHVTSTTVRVSLSPGTVVDGGPDPVTGHMGVGMNLESVVDWSPAWTFTDAFKASRPWISQTFNPQTFVTTWDPAVAPTLDLDANGNIRSLKTWTANGVAIKQYAATLMFDALGGDYAAGTYHAEWDGTGVVDFGFDAVVTSSGRTAAGRNFAELAVTPTDSGILMQIQSTSAADPLRDFNIWMPDYNGQSFRGQRWTPGAAFSPFHPLFLARLKDFDALRFMGWQETNGSDIATWSQRRDVTDIRQSSGAEGTPSEPIANGVSVEYMVELANELDADPWFNMPYQADDTFVRNFATYVADHLEPGRKVYVEWANEVWNFGYGFEASQWVADKARAAGLDPDFGQWIVAGQEAKRDMDIWSQVFAGSSADQLVRVAGGWAAVSWVTDQVLANMGGSFDAIAIAPYITPTDEQRAGYSGSTTAATVLADARNNIATSVQWTAEHAALATDWSTRLGRSIQLVAYEGGAHLDGRGAAYQNAFYAASNDPAMGEIYRDYLTALDAAGMDLYMDFQFTGQAGAAPWGDFAKLHRMDEALATAYRYSAVTSAATGSLWNV